MSEDSNNFGMDIVPSHNEIVRELGLSEMPTTFIQSSSGTLIEGMSNFGKGLSCAALGLIGAIDYFGFFKDFSNRR